MNNTNDFESAIDVALDDEHLNSTSFEYEDYTAVAQEIGIWLAIISDILIIFAVLMNRRMKSRRNILLMYWAIFDLIGNKLIISVADGLLLDLIKPTDQNTFEVCLIELSSGLFKFNCVVLMGLLVSTTVARLQFIKERVFKWCLCIATVLIYFSNLFVCYYVSPIVVAIKIMFVFLVLLAAVLTKEVNICCKARRDDPVSEKTKVKMNVVRIFTYNYVLIVFFSFLLLNTIDGHYVDIAYIMEMFIHFTPMYIFIYLYVADLNYRNAFRYCFKKSAADVDATVVYNAEENKDAVDFNRI